MSPVVALWLLFLVHVTSLGSRCFFYFDSRTRRSGNLTTPGWPGEYPPGLRCEYVFRGNSSQGIKILFTKFALEEPYRSKCLSDYLDISTVDHTGVRWFQGRYCGSEIKTPFQTLHPQVELLFVSNQAVADVGFSASFAFTEEASTFPSETSLGESGAQCGGLLTGPGGVLTSPGYPVGFPGGLACTWLLRADADQHVYVRMEELQLQGSIANCRKAELAIYDGYLSSYGGGGPQEKLKSFCGDLQYYRNSADKVVLSHRNRLVVTFRTGEPSDNTTRRAGFKISWTQVYFASRQSCEKRGWFWCGRSVFCLGVVREGGCITTANFCIHPALVCDGSPGCSDGDDTDERACTRALVAAAVSLSGVAVAAAVVVAVVVAVVNRRRRMRVSLSSNRCLALVSNASTQAAHPSPPGARSCDPTELNHIPLLRTSLSPPRPPTASFTSLPTTTSESLFPTSAAATPVTPSSTRTDEEVEKGSVPESTPAATTEPPTPATPEETAAVAESNSDGSSGSTQQSSGPNCSSAASTIKDLSLLQTTPVPRSSSFSCRSDDITNVAATSAESDASKKRTWRRFQETQQASSPRRCPLQPEEDERETLDDGESNEDTSFREHLASRCARHQRPRDTDKNSEDHHNDRDPPNYFDCDFGFPRATRSLPQTPTTPRRRTATWTLTWEDPKKKKNATLHRQKSSCCGKTSPEDSSLQDTPPGLDSPIPRWPPPPPLPPSRFQSINLAHSCPRRLHDPMHSPPPCSHHHHHHQPLHHHHHHHPFHRHDLCPPGPLFLSGCRHRLPPRRPREGAQHHLHHQPNHHHHHHHHGHHRHQHHVTRSHSWSSSLGGKQTEV
ncbi:uncharacterized protein LOC143031256 [Oratosquilla oratoria]|uniref:uncharacterized protein LOC143031256 n=1 Tax=Oratosquilla oratoria TaxID=337810 RepID=UPI003F77102D